MGEPRYLGTKEAAAYLGLSHKTLEKLRVTGEGPPYSKAGRRVIYDRRDLERWVSKRKRRFTGESVEESAEEGDCGPGDGGDSGEESIEEDDCRPGDGGESVEESTEEDDCRPEHGGDSGGDCRPRR